MFLLLPPLRQLLLSGHILPCGLGLDGVTRHTNIILAKSLSSPGDPAESMSKLVDLQAKETAQTICTH